MYSFSIITDKFSSYVLYRKTLWNICYWFTVTDIDYVQSNRFMLATKDLCFAL